MAIKKNNTENTETTPVKKRGGRKKTTSIAEPEIIAKDEILFSKEDEREIEEMGKSLVEGFDALLEGITAEIEKIDFSQFTQEIAQENYEFDENTSLEELKEKRKNIKTKINDIQISLAQAIETSLNQIADLKKHAKKLKKQLKKKK